MQEPELFTHAGFVACGLSASTSNALEADPRTARLPRLWRRFYSEALPAKLSANAANGSVVAVYSSYENGANGGFKVTAGVQLVRDQRCAEGYDRVVVSAGEYLRFTAYGSGAEAHARAWAFVGEFFSHNEHALAGKYERAYTFDFEQYGAPDSVSICIGVKRKLGVHLPGFRLPRSLQRS